MTNDAKLQVGIVGLERADLIHLAGRDRPDVWLATAGDVARWWKAREHLALRVVAGRIVVANDGRRPVTGARVVVERDSCTATLPVPRLDPGQRLTLRELDRGLPEAELRVLVAS